jgi:hypothetical protein
MTKVKKLRKFLRYLRRNLRPGRKTIVRLVDIKDCGELILDRGRYTIYIKQNQSWNNMVDSLIHEWAHVLDEWDGTTREEHRDSWGVWYSRCYRAYLKHQESRKCLTPEQTGKG